jgi:hypothetical protein
MSEFAFGSHYPPKGSAVGLKYLDIEVHDGVSWLSLNDHHRYTAGAKSLETSTQGRRRHTVSSAMYDGEWEVHSTKTNVQETVEVYIEGEDQTLITTYQNRIIEAFSQSLYNVRITRDDDVEIWRCFPAEYSIKRGHVNLHNFRSEVTFSVPRFPKVTYEVKQ